MTQPQAKYGVIFAGRHVRWVTVKRMEICMIGKYPLIEGGRFHSGRAYSLAKSLGERGDEVHIVTNAQDVGSGYSTLTFIPTASACGLRIMEDLLPSQFCDWLGGCRSASGHSTPDSDPLGPQTHS